MRTQLNGYVVSDDDAWLFDWFGIQAFSPQMVRDAIVANPEGEELVLEINSGGGSVFSGFEIYSVLSNAKCHTVAEVQSMAASAASVLMLGCDEVQASPVAQIMVHMPSVQTEGDIPAHYQSIAVLESITQSILNAYVLKCGQKKPRDELQTMMGTTTWMTAPEAQTIGLVDKIIGTEEVDPSMILNSAGGISNGIRSLAWASPSAGTLRREYARLVEEGKAPPRNGIQAQKQDEDALQLAKARLELEKIRF